MIVLGGGMAKSKKFLARVDEYVRRYGLHYPTKTDDYRETLARNDLPQPVQVVLASLGVDAGFIGAAGCARLLAKRG